MPLISALLILFPAGTIMLILVSSLNKPRPTTLVAKEILILLRSVLQREVNSMLALKKSNQIDRAAHSTQMPYWCVEFEIYILDL